MMTSLFSVPTLIRWVTVILPIHQILRIGQLSEVWQFLLQNPPSLYSPLNSHNLTPILKTFWTTSYYPLKGLSLYWGRPSTLSLSFQIKCPCQIFSHLDPVSTSSMPCWYQLGSAKENHTYHLYVPHPVLAALIWFPNTSPSLIQKLQAIQNSALRIATGCVAMTSIDHMQEETKMLPVQDHLSLISSQYLARTLQPNNPSHSVVTSPSGIRNMKQTLQSRFLHCVAPYLSSGILNLTNYRTAMKSLHTKAVTDSKSVLSHNRILQTASPQITPEEASLPRPYITTLSQLRASFCSSLHS